ARALPIAVGAGDQDDRPAVAFYEARGDDPDHALVPALARDDIGAPCATGLRPLLDRLDRLAQDPLLDRLPVAVQLLELGGKLHRVLPRVCEQELERRPRPAQAPRRVEPRGEPEADRTRIDGCRIDP